MIDKIDKLEKILDELSCSLHKLKHFLEDEQKIIREEIRQDLLKGSTDDTEEDEHQ